MLVRMWKKGTLIHCLWEYKLVQSHWKIVWRSLKKPKIELLYDPPIKECKSGYNTGIRTLMFIAALFLRAQMPHY
jgi:hypothetical protein